MKDWDLYALIIFYTLVMIAFGGFLEYQVFKLQMPELSNHYWTEGCKACAKFERDRCERDNLLVPESLHIAPREK